MAGHFYFNTPLTTRNGSIEIRIGINCFEDKIVELAVKQSLERVYEEIFEDSSYGYRPERSQHLCLGRRGRTIQQKRVSYLVESDIRAFFDEVSGTPHWRPLHTEG